MIQGLLRVVGDYVMSQLWQFVATCHIQLLDEPNGYEYPWRYEGCLT